MESSLATIKCNGPERSVPECIYQGCYTVLIIGVGLAVFQQFCGINVVFNYTTNIFRSIGASATEQLLQAVYISLVNLVFTLLAMVLVDKWGRRPLMLAGAGGLAVLYIIIGYILFTKNGGSLSFFILAAIGTLPFPGTRDLGADI
jgi:MFS family permease